MKPPTRPSSEGAPERSVRVGGAAVGVLAFLLLALPGGGVRAPNLEESAPEGLPTGKATLKVAVEGPSGALGGARIDTAVAGGRAPYRAQTDAAGRALFRGLPSGLARVVVRRSGFVRAEKEITLKEGEARVTFALVPGGRLRGTVVGPSQRPVAGASVRVRASGARPWAADTDDEGNFNFDTLPLGSVSLEITAHGYGRAVRQVKTTEDGEPPLRIALDIPALILGQVLGPDGSPAPEAEVTVAGSGIWPPRSAQAGPRGRFRFEGLPPGIYEVRARQGSLVAPAREGLSLATAARLFVMLHLEPGAALTGTVVDSSTDQPIEGTEVTVTEEGLGLSPRRTVTEPDGTFVLDGLTRQPHMLSATAEGYVAKVGETVRPGSRPVRIRLERAATLVGVVEDARGFPVAGALLEVLGKNRTGEMVAVSASGVGQRSALFEPLPDGAGGLGVTTGPVPPLPLDAVVGVDDPLAPGPAAAPGFTTPFQSADDGTFRITGIPAGQVQVLGRHPDHAPGLTDPIRVTPGAEITGLVVVLPEGGTVLGRLLDARGFPVPRVPVELRMDRDPVPQLAVSAEDGTFTFRGALGEIVLTALPEGHAAARKRLSVPPGDRLEVELTLTDARLTLRGRTLDPRDFPVAGAHVTVRSLRADTPVRRVTMSAEDGTFAVDGLPYPPYRLVVEHPEFAATELPSVEDADAEVQIHLRPGASVRGQVLSDWDGEAVEGARIHLVEAGGAPVAEGATDDAGEFEFSMIPAGDYEVLVDHSDFLPTSLGFAHAPGARGLESLVLDPFRLRPGGGLAGQVVDPLGAPVPGAEVALGDPPQWPESVRTDPAGRFALEGVAPGGYLVTARHPTAGERAEGPISVRARERTEDLRLVLPERVDSGEAPVTTERVHTGVAITVARRGNQIIVSKVVPRSRAARAGLRAGDQLLSVDDETMLSAGQARAMLSGPAGVEALLEIRRGSRTRTIAVLRERYLPTTD